MVIFCVTCVVFWDISQIATVEKQTSLTPRASSNPLTTRTSTCQTKWSVFYLKVHKTGSTTLSNILLNFGIINNLSIAFSQMKELKHFPEHPIDLVQGTKKRHKFNIIATHTVLDIKQIRNLMPLKTKVLASFRHPRDRLESAVNFFEIDKYMLSNNSLKVDYKISRNKLLKLVLDKPDIVSKKDRYLYFHTYAEELGMDIGMLQNRSYIKEYLTYLDTVIDVPIITEHFDESLLLLRKKLCWPYRDIMYLPLRVKEYHTNFKKQDLQRHKNIDPSSYIIYDHFLNKLYGQPEMKSPTFQNEVLHFKGMLERFKAFCTCRCRNNWSDGDKQCLIRKILFPRSQYYKQFEIDDGVCQRLQFRTVNLNQRVATYQYQEYCRHLPKKSTRYFEEICVNLPNKGVSLVDYVTGITGVPKVFTC